MKVSILSKQNYTTRDTRTDGTKVVYSGIMQPAVGIAISRLVLMALHASHLVLAEGPLKRNDIAPIVKKAIKYLQPEGHK